MSMIAKNRIHSQWTPLSNEETNNKIFEERKELVSKWFQKWNDDQRKSVFEELVGSSKKKQLEHARDLIDARVPCHKDDFTRYLPRVLTLYIFSHLDARSLCQCAQVCWYWRYLGELDQLWMPKCLHFGWPLTFTPSPYENGVWKRNFIEQFKIIQALLPKHPPPEVRGLKLEKRPSSAKKKSGPTPWRGSDPVPKDTWRFNILNNDEVVDDVSKQRQKKQYGSTSTAEMVRNARSKINTGNNVLNRSSSLTRISSTNDDPRTADRPRWARQMTTPASSGFVHKNAMKQSGLLGTMTRPAPVTPAPHTSAFHTSAPHKPPTTPKSRPITARSSRDPPKKSEAKDSKSTELFPQSPWKLPINHDSEED